MLHKPYTIHILILLYASYYTTLLSADEHTHVEAADRHGTKICIPTPIKNTLNFKCILAVITTSMQPYMSKPTYYSLYSAHNCTLSKMLLRFRGDIPEDLYTSKGWYLPSWAAFEEYPSSYNEYYSYIHEGRGTAIQHCIEKEKAGKRRIHSHLSNSISAPAKKELRQALLERLAVKEYQKDIYEITGIQPWVPS